MTDGRDLVVDYADLPGGFPVLVHAGSPGSRRMLPSADDAEPCMLELAQHLALVEQDSLGSGDQGWWDDNVAFLTPWGFDPAGIEVPLQLWHGEADKAVPPAFGHWLADRIPGVDAHFPADDDHGSIHDLHLAEAYERLRHHI
jgi:pimeloyl-ACP methyl ester carboxylesterase